MALVAVTLALSAVASGDGVLPGDVAVTRAIQGMSLPGGELLAAAVNAIGGTLGTCLVAVTVAYLCARAGHGAAAVVVLGALALRFGNALIKLPLDSPRPSPNLVYVAGDPEGLGFPSAHVMGVVLLYGALLLLAPELIRCRLRRGLVQGAALLMLLTIGYGRIAAGAHWPSDVLGAYLYGVLGLAALLALYRGCRDGRLPDPAPAARRAAARIDGIGAGLVRFLLLAPAPRRPLAQVVSARPVDPYEFHRRP
jgi:undecaprenyl-diphosphatase